MVSPAQSTVPGDFVPKSAEIATDLGLNRTKIGNSTMRDYNEPPLTHKPLGPLISAFHNKHDQFSITSSAARSESVQPSNSPTFLAITQYNNFSAVAASDGNQEKERKKTLEDLAKEWHASQVSIIPPHSSRAVITIIQQASCAIKSRYLNPFKIAPVEL